MTDEEIVKMGDGIVVEAARLAVVQLQEQAALLTAERDILVRVLHDTDKATNERIAEIDTLTKRAVSAEREAMVYRVLLTGAMIQAGFENKATDYGKFSIEYFTGLFGLALNSGGFFDEGCEWPEIRHVADLLHVDLTGWEE